MIVVSLCFSLLLVSFVSCLDNGVGVTPVTGFLSWERFRCETDCIAYPDECISESLYISMAEAMAKHGYAKAGYQYVAIDDCWASKQRAPNGDLRADPVRFPNGIKYIADRVHSLGLKLQIYTDIGTETCGGYSGFFSGGCL
jgi:alpha-N-acetylgalactosaminidase